MKLYLYIILFVFNCGIQNNLAAQCSTGNYFDGTDCITCPVGHYCPDGKQKLPCAKGKFQNKLGSKACYDCDAGTYSDTLGTVNCLLCKAGTVSSKPGSKKCNKCLPGQYQSKKGNKACLLCAQGKFTPDSGAVNCKNCKVGSFNNTEGADSCQLCLSGTYQNKEGSTTCIDCAVNTTSHEGGTSCFCVLSSETKDTTICMGSAIKGFNIRITDFPYGVFSGTNITPSGFFKTDLIGNSTIYYAYEVEGNPTDSTNLSLVDSFVINTKACVTSLEIENEEVFVYPNPFVSGFRIQNEKGEELTIAIFTIDGVELDVFKTNKRSYFYDASSLNAGSYLIQVSSYTFSVLKPIVKSSK